MPKVNLPRTVHVGGKVFFKGDAFVTDAEKIQIDTEIQRLEEIEAEAAEHSEDDSDKPKKGSKKSDK
jgi:hypothetical protein